VEKSAKDLATERGEPYVAMLSMEVDPENHAPRQHLNWTGMKSLWPIWSCRLSDGPNDTDNDIVDRWFQAVCRNIVLETWEQEQAMNPNVIVWSKVVI
jgi:hypothetical protein